MIHKYHSWDIVWLLVFTSVYTHVGLLAALARGGGGGRGEVCWTCDGGGCAGWCGPVSRPVMLQCPSSRRPLDNPASPCCTTSLHTHLHSYHWSGERAVMESEYCQQVRIWSYEWWTNTKMIWFSSDHDVLLTFWCKNSNPTFLQYLSSSTYSCILGSDMILKILSIEHIFIYFRKSIEILNKLKHWWSIHLTLTNLNNNVHKV